MISSDMPAGLKRWENNARANLSTAMRQETDHHYHDKLASQQGSQNHCSSGNHGERCFMERVTGHHRHLLKVLLFILLAAAVSENTLEARSIRCMEM